MSLWWWFKSKKASHADCQKVIWSLPTSHVTGYTFPFQQHTWLKVKDSSPNTIHKRSSFGLQPTSGRTLAVVGWYHSGQVWSERRCHLPRWRPSEFTLLLRGMARSCDAHLMSADGRPTSSSATRSTRPCLNVLWSESSGVKRTIPVTGCTIPVWFRGSFKSKLNKCRIICIWIDIRVSILFFKQRISEDENHIWWHIRCSYPFLPKEDAMWLWYKHKSSKPGSNCIWNPLSLVLLETANRVM